MIEHLVEVMGDELEIKEYKRLSPLVVGKGLKGDLKRIVPGTHRWKT